MYNKDYVSYEKLEYWEKKTIGEKIVEWGNNYGDRVAVVDENREITYKELSSRALEIAGGLSDRGIETGDRIVLQMSNSVTFVEAFFGIILANAIPIMALPAHRKGDLEGIFKLAKPKAYILQKSYMGYEYLTMAKEFKESVPSLEHVFMESDENCPGIELLSDLKGEIKKTEEISSYDTAILLLSGGTTETPKLIPRTHSDYMYNATMAAKKCGINEDSVYLSIIPIAHNFSLSCPGLFGMLNAGAKVVMAPSSSPDEVLPLIEEHKVTITAMVPALVAIFTEVMSWDLGYDLSSWKIVQVGGALLEPHQARNIIDEWPCQLMQVFGTAEGLICFTDLDDSDEVLTEYQGRPISPADEIMIVDENLKPVEEGEFGQLIARGPYTIDGYYMLPEVNKNCITEDGFYCTGDRASLSTKNGLKMGGRIKEQINRAGEKIMPAEVEGYLCKHELIDEAAVLGIKDDELGQKNCAFIKLNAEAQEEVDKTFVANFFKEMGVAHYKIPDLVFVVDKWPVTSVGKIDKKKLAVIALG